MPPKIITLTSDPIFGKQRNRKSSSWLSRLTQQQATSSPPSSAKEESDRRDTDAVSTRTRNKVKQRRIEAGPVSSRTRSKPKIEVSNDNIRKQQKNGKNRKDKKSIEDFDKHPEEITIEVNVSPRQETTYRNKEGETTQGRELTVDEWELHFRNERLAAEREQELIKNKGKHGNTSCETAQNKLSEKENCELQNCSQVSYEPDTSTISTSSKHDSLEEKGYWSKGITQIEKGLFEVYIDRDDTQKITGGDPGEYLDGTLDSDWIDAEFNIAEAGDDDSYAKYRAYMAQEYFHTQIAREREDRFTQEVLNKLKCRGIVIKFGKAVERETKKEEPQMQSLWSCASWIRERVSLPWNVAK